MFHVKHHGSGTPWSRAPKAYPYKPITALPSGNGTEPRRTDERPRHQQPKPPESSNRNAGNTWSSQPHSAFPSPESDPGSERRSRSPCGCNPGKLPPQRHDLQAVDCRLADCPPACANGTVLPVVPIMGTMPPPGEKKDRVSGLFPIAARDSGPATCLQ